jgi:oligosaccharide repeat unit polymerase
MNAGEFFWIIDKYIETYLVILVITICVYYFLLRKYIFSIFDPWFLQVVASVFSTSVVLFLFIKARIKPVYFNNYIITLTAFYGAFFFFSKLPRCPDKNTLINLDLNQEYLKCKLPNNFFLFFLLISLLDIFSQLILYITAGIPLLLESRLSVGMRGGGIGILLRLVKIPRFACIFASFNILFYDHKKGDKYYTCIYLFFILIFYVLSGSKATFFVILQIYLMFVYFNQNKSKVAIKIYKTKIIYFFAISCFFALLVIYIQNSGNINKVIFDLLFRLLAWGDVYFMAYPNDVITKVPKTDSFIYFFGEFLRFFRIIPESSIPRGTGFILNDIINNQKNSASGPNARFNIDGLINFGFVGSIVFSFCCGCFLAICRNMFIKKKDNSVYAQLFTVLIYLNAVFIETQPSVCIGDFTSNFFMIGFMCCCVYLITKYARTIQ